ncbi:MAG TPA: hypothetical protein VF848_05090 [Steroidobacteraceae bacterium]
MLSIATTLSGCVIAQPGNLYPIAGPVSVQNPQASFRVSISGVFNSGTISAKQKDGEDCRGHWATVPRDDPSAAAMSEVWDSVYGKGFFQANVLGTGMFARATLTGNKCTALNVQFYSRQPGAIAPDFTTVGVAADNQGDIFKLTF